MVLVRILIILLFSFNLIRLNNSELLRTDYYESLSFRDQCLVISHYNPNVNYRLYSFIFGYLSKIVFLDVSFKRVDIPCNNSFIFATMGKDFIKLEVSVAIYLYYYYGFITKFNFTLYNGFSAGIHEFFDFYQHYYLHVKIINDNMDNFDTFNSSEADIEPYTNLNPNEKAEFCLITLNNNAIVLQPEHGSYKPNGLLTGVRAEFFRGKKFFGMQFYGAFECNMDKSYPYKKIISIIDRNDLKIRFEAIYKFPKFKTHTTGFKLKLSNITLESINDLENIPPECNKLFLLKHTIQDIYCPDGTKRIQYLSYNNISYYTEERKQVKISSTLMQTQYISRSLIDPCQE